MNYTNFFYKQLGSGLSPQFCLYFDGFWGSKLLNGCLEVDVCEEYIDFQDSKLIFMISDFEIFPIMLLRGMNFGVLSV